MARTLHISLLGDVVIRLGEDVVAGFPSRAAEALLIYLACNPRPVAREKLAELLWAERTAEQALTNLRTVLTFLRRELEDYLVVNRQTLAFDHSREHWLDVAAFEQGYAALGLDRLTPLDAGRARRLGEVLDLYRGDFLEGFYLRDGLGFEEWATLERERLHFLALEGLRLLATYQLETGDYRAGIATATRWRRLDPYNEEACRTLMWLHTRAGQPHLGVQAYAELRRTLQADLGVKPGPATASLFECVQGARFPPPVSLPAAVTPFVGREAESEALGRLLLSQSHRLITLTGPGGIGKTRLAVEAARGLVARVPGRFLSGVYFVPLAAVSSAALLPTAIVSALGVELRGSDPPRRQLLAYLAPREALLILDNLEHLLDDAGEAVALLVDLLRNAPYLKLLVTSRERLGLYEEVVFDVPGLATPALEDAEEPPTGAMRLFGEAARRVRRDFDPAPSDRAAIAQVCRLAAGMPLAIELAAGWLRRYDCAEIARRMAHGLDFLAADYRDLPERQRSVRAAFEHSWRLLAPAEQAALARLSACAGGFTVQAADAVVGGPAPLDDLADKSLLQRQPDGRFDMHPLLRAYAAEKLALDPAAQAQAADAHAAYYLGYLAALGGGEAPEQRAAIRLELANLQAAWTRAAQVGMAEALERTAGALHGFYSAQSWFGEGIALFGAALAALPGDRPDLAGVRCELLARKARMHIHIGELPQAQADLQAALAALAAIPQGARRGCVLDSLAITHYYAGDYARAAALAEEALRLAEEAADGEGISFALNFLGSCAKAVGDYAAAGRYFEAAAESYLARGDELGAAMVFNNLGNLWQATGDWPAAQRYYERSSALFKAHDHQHGAATTLANAGRLAAKQGLHDQARRLLDESLALKRRIGDRRGEAVALAGLGDVALAVGDHAEAREHLRQALALAQGAGDRKLTLEVCVAAAELLWRQGQAAAAGRVLRFALEHPGLAQEARERAQSLAQSLGADRPVSGQDAPFADEAAVVGFLRAAL